MNDLLLQWWPVLASAAFCWPLAIAAGLLSGRGIPAWLRLAATGALPALLAALPAPAMPDAPFPQVLLGASFGLDETARVFLLFTALVWSTAAYHARGYITAARQREFFVWFQLAMAGNVGLLLARDIVGFYTFYALMSFSSYGLVVHTRERAACHAGKIYIALAVVGETLVFPALVAGYAASDTLLLGDYAAAVAAHPRAPVLVLLLVLGLGIKAGLLGLHVWLPLAHPAAPTPASAVLSGTMIKAGLYGMMALLPLGLWQHTGLGAGLMTAGLAAAALALPAAISQRDPKTLLAYSSISKMGLMLAAIGAGLHEPALWPAARGAILLFALHHALTKSALFLTVGALPALSTHPRTRNLQRAAGLIPLLAFAGVPLTSGAVAKIPFKTMAKEWPGPWSAALQIVLLFVAVATVWALARFAWMIWRDAMDTPPQPNAVVRRAWLGSVLLVALAPLIQASLGWGDAVAKAAHPAGWAATLTPLLAALAVAELARRRIRKSPPPLPAGDFLLLYQKALRALTVFMPRGIATLLRRPASSAQDLSALGRRLLRRFLPVQPYLDGSEHVEHALRDGPLAGAVILIVLVLLVGTLLI